MHDAERFWREGPAAALAALHSAPEGLSEAEARARLAPFGPNSRAPSPRRRWPARLARRLAEPLIAILVAAALLSGLTGEWASCAIILLILSLSIALDMLQEHRAERALEALRGSVALTARTLRDGREREVPTAELVPGDVVRLGPGDLVPADGVVLQAVHAEAQEALLTGEPYPVEKRPGPSHATAPAQAHDALFAGTALMAGEAEMLVIATGPRTRFGAIAAALEAEPPPTAFQRGLHALGLLILRLTAFLVLFLLLTHLAFGRDAIESFLFAIALAVGLTPELLPMITTVTLSRGAQRMARRQVVVKRLSAIHDLGAMSVLCTDKTGTLTEARVELTGQHGAPETLELAAVNAGFARGVPNPLDAAILAAQPAPEGWRRLDDLPFDFTRRRSAVLAEGPEGRLLLVKGAAEEVLALCTRALHGGFDRAALQAEQAGLAASGLRCLAVALRPMPGAEAIAAEDEAGLAFAGFLAFSDPAKPDAAASLARLARLGVAVKIVSGDAAEVVRHLAGEVGLGAPALLTGEEIARLDDDALAARAEAVTLFARVSPEQKARLVRALKARGHTVGFLGDGINDAPAIRAADAGLSVAGATEVARAAADLILLEQDLRVVADGVAEGRRTYANIMKHLRMGTSSNFGNMLSMAVASLFIPFLPLTPVQVLLNNLLYDLSETGIPFDAVDEAELAAPQSWNMGEVLRFTLVMGPLSSAFDLATFAILLLGFGATPEEFRTAWFIESMATQILVIFLIRTRGPAFASLPHPALAASSLGALALALALALGPLAPWLGFAPLPGALLGAVAVLVAAYLLAAERLKRHAAPRG
jgi:Mg2+-importing ATPase